MGSALKRTANNAQLPTLPSGCASATQSAKGIKVHKIALRPNNRQRSYFAKAAGTARFSYNWALAEWQRLYAQGERPSEISLRSQLNAVKKTQYPWMEEVTKNAPQQAIKNLGTAYKRFFRGLGKYPRFKKKGEHDAFRADNGPFLCRGKSPLDPLSRCDAVTIKGKKIKLPCLGWVRMAEELRFNGLVKSVTVSRQADRWFASVAVETFDLPKQPAENQSAVGVDLGIHSLATLSTGEKIAAPRPRFVK